MCTYHDNGIVSHATPFHNSEEKKVKLLTVFIRTLTEICPHPHDYANVSIPRLSYGLVYASITMLASVSTTINYTLCLISEMANTFSHPHNKLGLIVALKMVSIEAHSLYILVFYSIVIHRLCIVFDIRRGASEHSIPLRHHHHNFLANFSSHYHYVFLNHRIKFNTSIH